MDVKSDLIALRKALFDFSKRNPFVHIKRNKLWFPDQNPVFGSPEKLYQKANYYQKEYGLDTALEVHVFIKWKPPVDAGKSNDSYLISPLIYTPCKIKRTRKLDTVYSVEHIGEFQYNPILRHYFNLFFELDLPIEIQDLDEEMAKLMAFFSSDIKENPSIKMMAQFDETDEWQLITQRAVGNFNYKKSSLGADYQKIIDDPNEQILSLLSNEIKGGKRDLILPEHVISNLDQSQKDVIAGALNNNTVIQGPPGTGKSHTIVALIGAFLAQQKRVLFVSEKKSALDVVNDRLENMGLGALVAYFNTDKDQKKILLSPIEKNLGRIE